MATSDVAPSTALPPPDEDAALPDDAAQLMQRIQLIQASLVDLQKQVIQGGIPPAEYMAEEKARVGRIHKLEERLAALA